MAAYIGRMRQAVRTFASTVDTGAGSSFIRRSAIPENLENEIHPLTEPGRVKDVNKRTLQILGTIALQCQVGTRADIVTFYVVERLATSAILG